MVTQKQVDELWARFVQLYSRGQGNRMAIRVDFEVGEGVIFISKGTWRLFPTVDGQKAYIQKRLVHLENEVRGAL